MHLWFDTDGSHHTFGDRYRMAWRIKLPKKGGAHHLAALQKQPGYGGAQLLMMAETYVAKDLGGSRLTLQDASFVHCGPDGHPKGHPKGPKKPTDIEFDLGFRSLLVHGKTWYERQGYRAIRGISEKSQDATRVAVKAFSEVDVKAVREAVRRQIELLQDGRTYVCDDGSLFSSALTVAPEQERDAPAQRTRPAVLKDRMRLLRILETAPNDARLGTWLPTLSCEDYAAFMRLMYGTRTGPSTALTRVGGERTPTLALFKRANRFRRTSHRILWAKDL